MKKIWQFLLKEEILQIMGFTFLFVALATFGAVNFAPLHIPTSARAEFYTSTTSRAMWIFALAPPIVISLIVGIIATSISLLRKKTAS